MGALSQKNCSFYLLTIVFFSGAFGVQIQLFKEEVLTGLLWETNSTDDCKNIPHDKIVPIYSIRTDACLIVYTGRDCKSRWTAKYMPGSIYLSENQVGRRGLIYSFHLCNDKEGGDQLNVDLTKHYEFNSVLQSYKSVCSCVNIPKHVQNMSTWSINNHHNDIMAYYEPDCSERKFKSTLITAGHNDVSNNAYFLKKKDSVTKTTYKIQSFGPHPYSSYQKMYCKVKALSDSFDKLQEQFNNLKRRQEIFQGYVVRQPKDELTKLNKNIAEHVRNLTV